MKELAITIIKKNRKYFAVKYQNSSFEFKLLIDDASRDLTVGDHILMCDDISVRSKYGTDTIFKVVGVVEKKSIVSLKTPKYNAKLVEKCHALGGKWDPSAKAWIFNSFVAEQVEELDALYNSELVTVQLTANDDLYFDCKAATFMGYTVCIAFGRDSGAKLGEEVALIKGKIGSAGSVKNWKTEVLKGSIFVLQLPRSIVEQYKGENWAVKFDGQKEEIKEEVAVEVKSEVADEKMVLEEVKEPVAVVELKTEPYAADEEESIEDSETQELIDLDDLEPIDFGPLNARLFSYNQNLDLDNERFKSLTIVEKHAFLQRVGDQQWCQMVEDFTYPFGIAIYDQPIFIRKSYQLVEEIFRQDKEIIENKQKKIVEKEMIQMPTEKQVLKEMAEEGYECEEHGTLNNHTVYLVKKSDDIWGRGNIYTISQMRVKFLGYGG